MPAPKVSVILPTFNRLPYLREAIESVLAQTQKEWELIIADEPTSSLDPVTQSQIVYLLGCLSRQRNVTMLYISHDLLSVLQLADRVAVLDGGRIVECLPTDRLAESQHRATRALLTALPAPPEVLLQFCRKDDKAKSEEMMSY